jgi:endoglucanase
MRRYILLLGIMLCTAPVGMSQQPIKLNQLGFYPDAEKIAVIPGPASGEFRVIDVATGQVVYAGEPGVTKHWQYSAENVALADFSNFTIPGTYRIEHETAGSSYPFEIKDYVHTELVRGALRAYYFNRASTALTETYAGRWARPAGHPDTSVIIHSSAATGARPVGSRISSPKGWYDAGDYNKYIVNSGISTYTLLAAYEHFSEYFGNITTNIPDGGDGLPDILREARWNIDWMVTMQDPDDGGVYHKLTTAHFAGVVMPHAATAPRYVVKKSTAAALNFAAVMAVAARVYEPFDTVFAHESLIAAERAWEWALENPNVYYNQTEMNQQFSPAIHTGEYGDTDVSDEFDWAAAELYITTKNDAYWNARNFPGIWYFNVPSWQNVRALAFVSLLHHREDLTAAANVQHVQDRIIDRANNLRDEYESSAYGVSMGHMAWEFVWGSNSMALNHSLLLIQAYRISNDTSYLNAAQSNLDYVLGRNATGYSFVTGYGSYTPMDPHHRQSAADGVPEPVPGFVVGGPHSGQQDGCTYPSDLPALSYLDDWCSYSTNEVAINWNAPLVYVAGALDALKSGSSPPVSVGEDREGPMGFLLQQNYPNPFNPSTNIRYQIPTNSSVTLNVYDVLGRHIATLVNEHLDAGTHEVVFDASNLTAGMYIYRLRGDSFEASKVMLYIR